MRKGILHICFLLAGLNSWSQSSESPASYPLGESCRMLTDRSIYVAGEDIRFTVFYRSPGGLEEPVWSKVFYAELISPGGTAYSRTKIKIDSAGSGGRVEIPVDLPSGTYFLRGYTRWMKNYGPASYAYLSVDVVNPVKKTVLQTDTLSDFTLSLSTGLESFQGAGTRVQGMPLQQGKRELVDLELNLEFLSSPLECCVTVIRQGSLKKQWASVLAGPHGLLSSWIHVPETRGIAITGRVEEDSSGIPVPFAVVYISLMGRESVFLCNFADSAGRFFFSIPDTYMKHDLFISANHPGVSHLRVHIDQDFCLEPVKLPSFPFRVAGEDQDLIKTMVIHAQIQEQYQASSSESEAQEQVDKAFFYGEPSSVIRFDEFIRLPTMEEYFTELIPPVSLTRSRRTKSFTVLGTHPDLKHYDPLVMIDGVAVFDIESVLAISPAYIERIEIVEAPFVRGNLTFGGIIHLISRKGDMGYIDLPASGLLVNYSMYDKPIAGDPVIKPGDPRMPDVRNTLYWDPYLRLRPHAPQTISFYTPDAEGAYEAVLRGFDPEGGYVEYIIPFQVD